MTIARSAVKAAMLTVLQARTVLTAVNADTGVAPQITRTFETVWQSRERIVIGDVTGTLSIPTIRAGAKTVVDEFDVHVYFVVAIPGQTTEQNEDRCTVLVDDVVAALTLTANLGGAVAGNLWAVPGSLEGPSSHLDDVADVNTHTSSAVLTVACQTRIYPS